MTPQKTMWHLYSKSQPEEEASVIQILGMKDLLYEKVYIYILDIRNIIKAVNI